MAEPKQKPGRSKQDYGTPREFLDAVERRFGKIAWDLAAHADNCVVPDYLGPGSSLAEDSLAIGWTALPHGYAETLWLNPPYSDIRPWAFFASGYTGPGRVIMLTPASIGSKWFADHVYGVAEVHALRPRLTFVGCEHPYPKDLMLSVFDRDGSGGFYCWDWTK